MVLFISALFPDRCQSHRFNMQRVGETIFELDFKKKRLRHVRGKSACVRTFCLQTYTQHTLGGRGMTFELCERPVTTFRVIHESHVSAGDGSDRYSPG